MSKAIEELQEIREIIGENRRFKYKNIILFNCDIIEKDLNKYEKLKALLYEAYGYDEEEYLLFIKVIEDER